MPIDAATQILHGSQKAGKTYGFDEAHDPARPTDLWFQESDEGLVLFVVFYTQACRWSRCLGCNLPSKQSRRHISYKYLMAQVDHVLRLPEVAGRRADIRKVIASNNGSVLDEVTFSSTALVYFIANLNLQLPNLRTLSLETRPEYVDLPELEFLARVLAEGEQPTGLELAVGFEAFDERIRNAVFDKGLSLAAFEGLVRKVAPFGFRVKCYFMQKPVPGMSDEEAVADIRLAIDYLAEMTARHRVPINMHLNPTFVAAGTVLEDAFRRGEYAPPKLRDVARAALHARGKRISIFIGLTVEGLAVNGGSAIRNGDGPLVGILERFNRTQDYSILDAVARDDGEPGT